VMIATVDTTVENGVEIRGRDRGRDRGRGLEVAMTIENVRERFRLRLLPRVRALNKARWMCLLRLRARHHRMAKKTKRR